MFFKNQIKTRNNHKKVNIQIYLFVDSLGDAELTNEIYCSISWFKANMEDRGIMAD